MHATRCPVCGLTFTTHRQKPLRQLPRHSLRIPGRTDFAQANTQKQCSGSQKAGVTVESVVTKGNYIVGSSP